MKSSSSRAPRSGAQGREHGAAAVEFALVAPILLALVGGIIEFSHAYNLQISVTQAAREAARTMAITHDAATARAAGVAGAPGLTAASFGFNIIGDCADDADDANTTVTVTYTAPTLTGMLGTALTLRGRGAMRCGG
jgi:Flp pilus assembly protein TadG